MFFLVSIFFSTSFFSFPLPCSFPFPFFLSLSVSWLALGEDSWLGEIRVVRNCSLCPVDREELSVTASSWGSLSLNHLAELLLDSWSSETVWHNNFFFCPKLLNLEVICYVTVDNEYIIYYPWKLFPQTSLLFWTLQEIQRLI